MRRLDTVLNVAAGASNRSFEEFHDAVRERLRSAAAEHERIASERHDEEARLVADLLHERGPAAAARVYADDGLIQRVARAESHLSRELDRALILLVRRRAERNHEPAAVRAIDFVLSNGDERQLLTGEAK